jgi:hypothetical protein
MSIKIFIPYVTECEAPSTYWKETTKFIKSYVSHKPVQTKSHVPQQPVHGSEKTTKSQLWLLTQ